MWVAAVGRRKTDAMLGGALTGIGISAMHFVGMASVLVGGGITWDANLVAMSVLLGGVFFGMKHAAPVMCAQRSGSIINTGSVAGILAGYSSIVYSAAKAAVIHLTRVVAMELGESNVRVNCISPGGIATGIFGKGAGLPPDQAEKTAELMKKVLEDVQPIRRAGIADDIAQAAVFLGSDESTFINGHNLVVDGGLTGGRLWSVQQEGLDAMRQALIDFSKS